MGTFVIFALIMLVTMTVSGIIGFAGSVIALPLLSQILDLTTVVAVLSLSGFIQATVQAVQNRKQIDWRTVLFIVLCSLISMPLGAFSLHYLPETLLKAILGVFIVWIALKQLWVLWKKAAQTATSTGKWDWLYLVGGGFFTGAFAAGGPLVVIYCSKHLLEKDIFRGTMFANGCFAMGFVVLEGLCSGQYTQSTLSLAGIALVIMVAAVWLSGQIARRIDTRKFSFFVNVALTFAGAMLLIQTVPHLLELMLLHVQ